MTKADLSKPLHRVKIIQGHMRAIEKMIDQQAPILEVIHQSLAVQRALKKLDMALIKEHLETDTVEQFQNNQIEKSVAELLKLYELK
ncbi:MAG: metal-sensitive transcriptional regulator [Patescibacteria group bacterium]